MVTRIVKIGGASITDKNQFEHVQLNHIDFIVNLFKTDYRNLILIHGAGSFGHHQAKKYKLTQGFLPEENLDECRWGVCDTRRSLVLLQQHLLAGFLRIGIPVIAVSPFDYLRSDDFQITDESFENLFQRLEFLIENGFVPMLNGDVLLDKKRHWRIYSGDDLILKLAERFKPKICAFLTSVRGVLRDNGSVIEKFFIDEDQVENTNENETIDVTGSMKNKVEIASEIVRRVPQCQVFILQGFSENARQLLSGSIDHLEGCTQILKKTIE